MIRQFFFAMAALTLIHPSAGFAQSISAQKQTGVTPFVGYGIFSYDVGAEYRPYRLVGGFSSDLGSSHWYVLRYDALMKWNSLSWNILYGVDIPIVEYPTLPGGITAGTELTWSSLESPWILKARLASVSFYPMGRGRQTNDHWGALFPSVQLAYRM